MTLRRPVPWALIIWFGLLLAACYVPVVRSLVHDWSVDDDMGHGFFVPVVAAYIVWLQRAEILAEDYKPDYRGLLLVVLGAIQFAVGTLGAELFVTRTSMLVSLTGVIFTLGGWQLTRKLVFPLVLLVFMVPLPSVIYYQITFPLQKLASRVAEVSLNLIGIPVLREGNVLELPSQKLSVAEACSGIRSLLSLTFLALVYGYFFDQKRWMRWVLPVVTVPIAIAANAMRVTLTGVFSEYDPELASGVFHSLEGWVIFMVALVLLVITHQLMNLVYRRLYAGR